MVKNNLPFLGGMLATIFFAGFASIKTWPLLDGDAPAYFSPAVEFSQGRGLVNPVWLPPLDDSIDGPGGRRYIYHGFLYPLLIGWLAKSLGGGSIFCLAWMHCFNVVASAACAMGVLGFYQPRDKIGKILSFLLPVVFFSLCEAYAGRPEPVVFFLIGLGLMAIKHFHGPTLSAALSFFCGLVFLSSPAMGVLGFLLFLAFQIQRKEKTNRIEFLGIVLAFTGALAVCFTLYPYPALDWFQGVWRHSQINLALPQGQGFILTWVTLAQSPFLIFTWGVPAILALRKVPETVRHLMDSRRAGFGVVLALFILGVIRLAFFKTEASYNALVWLPVFLAVLLQGKVSGMVRILVLLVLGLPALGFVRSSLVLAHQSREGGVPFGEVRELISAKEREGVQVSPGLFFAAKNPFLVIFGDTEAGGDRKPVWRIEQQTNRGIQEPIPFPGYELVKNRFGDRITFLGIPISRTPGGWEYALYRRLD